MLVDSRDNQIFYRKATYEPSCIVVANTGIKTIGVFLGYGNASFAPVATYSTGNGSYPTYVAVGDFGSDGQLDIVMASDASNGIAVLLGLGNGSFTNMTMYSIGENSGNRAAVVADFNKDGRLDIVVVNTLANNVGIFFGHGNGTFTQQVTFSLGSKAYPFWIIVSDFNSDDQLDIATANYYINDRGILLGYENGSFTLVKNYATGIGSQPSCISLGDFNNDSISDIAVTNFGTNNIVVLFGFGDGSFVLGRPYSTGSRAKPWGLVTGDFNKDNQLDIAAVTDSPNTIGLFLGYNSQPFGDIKTFYTSDKSHPHAVALGHFNNDT